jgi:DNA-binding XRE family transcriptional regulator
MNAAQFRELIVVPVLNILGLDSKEAQDILIMTMAHESNCGEYLMQLGTGPALGVYQMEKGTYNDLWKTLNDINSPLHSLAIKVLKASDIQSIPEAEEMEGNLYLATAMARVYYARIRKQIPKDLVEMSQYVKIYWNTEQGKATSDDYLRAYYKFNGID